MSYKTLDYVVNTVLNDVQDYSEDQRARYLQFAVQAWKELNFSILPNIKVAYLTIEDNYTAALPDDFVDYTKIGVVVSGQIITLSLNKNIQLQRKKDGCGNDLVEVASACACGDLTAVPNYGYYFQSHYRGGQYVGEQYGIGGGYSQFGVYRIDHEMNRIQFQNTVPNTEIILEYKSNGLETDGSALVPEDAVMAMVEYVHQRRLRFDPKANTGQFQVAWDQYVKQFTILKRRKLKFTMSEYLDSCYRGFKQGPKR